MNVNLDANTIGARITIALVVLGLVLEVLSDNWPTVQGTPMSVDTCVEICTRQGEKVARVEAWACECRPLVSDCPVP